MDEISEVDATNNLSSLLDQVQQGRDIVITRAGKPVARLVAPLDKNRAEEAVEELRALRASIGARGGLLSIDEILSLRDEGRR